MRGEEIRIPREMLEEVAALRLPARSDQRLQHLMDGNNDGRLNPSEREELESLVEMIESMSLMRAKALCLLGRSRI